MKHLLVSACLLITALLSGCLEITQENTIRKNGSGVYRSSYDLSAMMAMVKMMAKPDDLEKLQSTARDTSMSLGSFADSVQDLSDAEKRLLLNGSMQLMTSLEDEKLVLGFVFPYKKLSDLAHISSILKKIGKEAVSRQMNALGNQGSETMIEEGDPVSSLTMIDAAFDNEYKKGKLSRKINKERYAAMVNDKGIRGLHEMGKMSNPVMLKTVINLPKKIRKIQAKAADISPDKKRITISASVDDLLNDPSKLEYEIEY